MSFDQLGKSYDAVKCSLQQERRVSLEKACTSRNYFDSMGMKNYFNDNAQSAFKVDAG